MKLYLFPPSSAVLGLAAPDPAFIARGEQNFARFAGVLDDHLKGRAWLIGERLTIADFSIGPSCRARRASGSPSRASPRSLAGTRAWPRCPAGGMPSPPRTRPWQRGSRTEAGNPDAGA